MTMKLLLIAAILAIPGPAFAGCNSWDYTPWECGYVYEMRSRQADLEDQQRRLEDRQRDMERQNDSAPYRPY